ncbi:MAG: hypothetical protein ACK43N_14305, partial [Pirellulaceae bacterium]
PWENSRLAWVDWGACGPKKSAQSGLKAAWYRILCAEDQDTPGRESGTFFLGESTMERSDGSKALVAKTGGLD